MSKSDQLGRLDDAGKALADTVTYASEYKEEAEKENKTKKQGGTKDGN